MRFLRVGWMLSVQCCEFGLPGLPLSGLANPVHLPWESEIDVKWTRCDHRDSDMIKYPTGFHRIRSERIRNQICSKPGGLADQW